EKDSYLELWHGPTCAFKDMALTVLSGLLEQAKLNLNDKSRTVILTATSGDTGSATLSGFLKSNINAIVLYPNGGVSPVQEAQMQYFAKNGSRAVAIDGNFDFCQTLVKKVFSDKAFSFDGELSSANSINIGRLVPQIVYYMYSYLELCRRGKISFGEKIVFSVPTGNFGDILAGYIAKMLGVPVEKFICASNSNDVLAEFFESGVYDRNRPFYKTISPSMDILVSSNLERLLYVLSGCNGECVADLMNSLNQTGRYQVDEKIKKGFIDFYPFRLDDNGTKREINDVYADFSYLIDPHTAVASAALKAYRKASGFSGEGVVVSTASPYKFPIPVSSAIGLKEGKDIFDTIKKIEEKTGVSAPDSLKKLKGYSFERVVWSKEEAEEELKKMIAER
ncbi:MAG: threonine synthase, partial [Clostridia bacterium]|nr:threonine synthase [Clostridia bacterium]